MNCPSSHSLFLRSNGSLVCWDDRGQLKELQVFDSSIDYAEQVYINGIYKSIREKLDNGQMPFPEYCANCCVMMTDHDRDDLVTRRAIETFQVEPSMACQLDCPGCISRSDRSKWVPKRASGHMTLKPEVLYKIVTDLKAANIKVKKFDMQGSGEPLLNKKIWDMCRFLADIYPDAIRSICTHANADFKKEMIASGVNELLFAIDGVDQSSYAPWRINGDFERAYRFMNQFSTAAASEAPHIKRVWKYVLFDYNDSDEQLIKAQHLAKQSKIDVLRFVLTQLGPASKRIFQIGDIPRLDVEGAAEIVMDSYLITIKQLRSSIGKLQLAVACADAEQTDRWAAFVGHSIYRLFNSRAKDASNYKHIIHFFLDILSDLPASRYGKYDGLILQTTNLFNDYFNDYASRPLLWHEELPPSPDLLTVSQMRSFVTKTSVDDDFYLKEYPDVAISIREGETKSAKDHYQNSGYCEGRLPSYPVMDTEWYLAQYADVKNEVIAGNTNPVLHFIWHGYKEGRSPHGNWHSAVSSAIRTLAT